VERLRADADLIAHALRVRLGLDSASPGGRFFAITAPFALAVAAAYGGIQLMRWYAGIAISPGSTRSHLATIDSAQALNVLLLAMIPVGAILALTRRWMPGRILAIAGLLGFAAQWTITPALYGDGPFESLAAALTAVTILACPPDLAGSVSDWPDLTRPGSHSPDLTRPGSDQPDLTRPGSHSPDLTRPGSHSPDLTRPGSHSPDLTRPGSDWSDLARSGGYWSGHGGKPGNRSNRSNWSNWRLSAVAGGMAAIAWFPVALVQTRAFIVSTDYGAWPLLTLALTGIALALHARPAGLRELAATAAASPLFLAHAYTTGLLATVR
jgi:hypothetical protein